VTTDPRPLIVAGICLLFCGAVAYGVIAVVDNPEKSAAAGRAARPSAQPGVPVPQREKAPPVAESMKRDGVYVAGRQIKTGTYTAEGGSFCYWARLKYTPAGTTSVLVSSYAPDRQVVAILSGDIFQTSGCGEWVTVR
jgi:hypothetical protein